VTHIYGHRGAKGEAPENTLVSFQKCLESGVNRCELDLHLSRDGQLMVIHDPSLKRTTGHRGKVIEHDAAELVAYDARKGGPGWVHPCPIPRLEELFSSVHSSIGSWKSKALRRPAPPRPSRPLPSWLSAIS
jgi:glycerophosphoryl diester phosphodiesterase